MRARNTVTSPDRLREKWPWNGEFLRLMLVFPSLMGIAAAGALYSTAGVHALWFLTAVFAGVVLFGVYGAVGRKVEALKNQFVDDAGELAEGLLVVGKMQSPGLVVLRSSEVELAPIIGERCTIALHQIESIKEGQWLPGKYVWGKRAFILHTSIPKRLAFAVPESIGARWSVLLASRR